MYPSPGIVTDELLRKDFQPVNMHSFLLTKKSDKVELEKGHVAHPIKLEIYKYTIVVLL